MTIKDQNQPPQADNMPDEETQHALEEAASLDGSHDDIYEYDRPSDAPAGYIQINTDKDAGNQPQEQDDDLITLGANADVLRQTMDDFTNDEETLDDFAERQELADTDRLLDQLRQHNRQSPRLTGQDIDADWQGAEQSGEEAVGGSVSTPDQDVVSELGQAVGMTYADTEPLDTLGKLEARDEDRWELNPASAEDAEQEEDEAEDEAVDWDDDFLVGGVDVEEE